MKKILRYISNLAEKHDDIGFEGIVVLSAEGRKIFEKRWIQDYPRDIYSNTKSFVGAAAGIAIREKKITLNTKVTELFNVEKMNCYWEKLSF